MVENEGDSMERILKECTLCPKKCRVDRTEKSGICGATDKIKVARASLHFWEEPCVSGEKGSGTVFFSYCSLKCVYCQNFEISRGNAGKEITVERLSEIFLELQGKGAHNINLVTPTHYAVSIIKALKNAKEKGLTIPVVYNTSGYESTETLKLLEGFVDIYLVDFKYMDENLALKYSKVPDYPKVAQKAIEEMVNQVGESEFKDDIMQKGVIVRHLLLPGHLDDSRKILKYLYETYENKIFYSLMSQYTPVRETDFLNLNKKVTEEEYESLVDFAVDLGIENGFIQEGEASSESFIPEFDNEGV